MNEALPTEDPAAELPGAGLERWLNRAGAAGLWLVLFLPFARVSGCGSSTVEEYWGIEVMARSAPFSLFVQVMALVLLVAPDSRPRAPASFQALVLAWRAVAVGLSGLALWFGQMLLFMLSDVEARIGLYVQGLSWTVILLTVWGRMVWAQSGLRPEPASDVAEDPVQPGLEWSLWLLPPLMMISQIGSDDQEDGLIAMMWLATFTVPAALGQRAVRLANGAPWTRAWRWPARGLMVVVLVIAGSLVAEWVGREEVVEEGEDGAEEAPG